MTTSDERAPVEALEGQDILAEQASVDHLHKNALSLPAVLFSCIACIAPMAAVFFNVPGIAFQAGASTPLVFVLSAFGLLLLGVTIVYFARRLSSAGGFYTWVRHGLGKGAAFQAGWLMFAAYAIFEAASQAAFGGLTDLNLSTYLNFHIFGGWVTYALLSTLVVCALAFFDVKWSVWVLAPFAILELLALFLMDFMITIKGGAAGHDLLHTFTTAGSDLKGVAPGGLLGIGIAMALGIWSCIGFESGAAYGEEARNPRRALPIAIFSVLVLIAVLFIWTTYSAIIGLGWTHAVDTLGNIAIAPTPYYDLADKYVGSWLKVAMIILVSTSTFASCLVFHQAMVRYLYAMGREKVLPAVLGKTHSRFKSPYVASFIQTAFTVVVIVFLAFVIQKTNADNTTSYALGIPDGKIYTQTNGIGSYQWLAIIGTISLLVVYIMTNIASPLFARRRGEFNIFTHVVAPVLSTLALLIPLVSFVMPPIPGIGSFFTNLGFSPTPFPLNILPLFVIVWVVLGLIYAAYLSRKAPERYEQLGRIIGEEA